MSAAAHAQLKYRCTSPSCDYSSDFASARCPRCDRYIERMTSSPGAARADRPAAPAPTASAIERPPSPSTPASHRSVARSGAGVDLLDLPESDLVPITEVELSELLRNHTGIEPLDRVLGGGLVLGGSFLISGGPGAGKSTLLSQMLHLARRPDGTPCERLMWATAEETTAHVAMRARRIGAASQRIRVTRETNVDRILAHAAKLRSEILVVDSIQTVSTDDLESVTGSVQQVKECATRIDRFAKTTETCAVLICQVNKDGQNAGPNTLKHLVDVLLSIEVSDEFPSLRFLSSEKNRFGSVLETGCFEMGNDGLRPIPPPPAREDGSGERGGQYDDLGPVAQELVYRILEAGGEIDPGLRDRIGDRLDLTPRGSR